MSLLRNLLIFEIEKSGRPIILRFIKTILRRGEKHNLMTHIISTADRFINPPTVYSSIE